MSSVGKEALAFDENFIATPHQATLLSVFFCFFRFRFLDYWDHYCKFAGFGSLKPN